MKKWGAAARRGLAEIRQGTMTSRSKATARKRDAVWSRNPPSPDQQGWRPVGARLGRHGADHASRGASVVGTPSRSYSHACGVPPRIWRGTRRRRVGAPNAARPTSSTGLCAPTG